MLDFSLVRTDVDICVKDGYVYLKDVALFAVSKLHLVGKHNLQNAMVAASMAYLMGVSQQDIEDGIDAFKGVEHRTEYVTTKKGVDFFNDSKATNTDAAIAGLVGLSSLNKPIRLIAGGMDKKISFTDWVKLFIPIIYFFNNALLVSFTALNRPAFTLPSAYIFLPLRRCSKRSVRV